MTEAQKERKRQYDREFAKKYYQIHKDEIRERNNTEEAVIKRRKYQSEYRKRTRKKALAHIRFSAYDAGTYIVKVKEDGKYSFEMKEQHHERL